MLPSHPRLNCVALVCALIATCNSQAAAPTLAEVLRAVQSGLAVRISVQAERSAEADRVTADHAPLPVLSAKASQIDLQNGLGAGDPIGRKRIDKSLGLDWTWERGDKRLHRTRVAQYGVDAAKADVAETATQQMIVAQAAYYDWLSSRERMRLVRETLEVANAAVSAAHSRLKAGDLSTQDALRIEIDAKRVEADMQSARLDLERSEIALGQFVDRQLLARSRDEPVMWPPSRSFGAGTVAKPITTEQRPDVRAAKSRIEAATASLDGARALAKVDPTWGVSFDHYPGTSSRLLELRVQIPLTFGYHFEGEIARAQSELAQSELVAERVARDAQAELNRLEAEAASTSSRATQFDADIVPRATTVLRQAEFAYARGALSLTDLLDARRTQRATQVDALSARTDAAKAGAALMLRTHPETLIQ